jgi:hypothetical protein
VYVEVIFVYQGICPRRRDMVSTISGQREISTITYDVTFQKEVVVIGTAVRI